MKGNTVQIVRSRSPRRETRGAKLVRRLKGKSTVRLSTDEIMSLTRK
ncbi:MAG TPA: hypothetical protein VNA04_02745 [Thermoanaerobaculia bacterium]|nr:hypothetical protein [Thermoanaerobaculia bacterium]